MTGEFGACRPGPDRTEIASEPVTVVYKSDPVRGAIWHAVFAAEAPHLRLVDWTPDLDLSAAPYLVAWTPPPDLATAMPALRILFCIGAGVDHLPFGEIAPDVLVVRMVDPELTRSMVEYVVMAVLAQHRDLPAYLVAQREGRWAPRPVRRAADHTVGILGLGTLGRAVAEALRGLGFPVRGWGTRPKDVPGVESFAGPGQLAAFLGGTHSLVCLLPLTPDTAGIVDRRLLAGLPRGAGFVNVGRGGHVVEADLLAALDAGHLSSAVLDVLSAEPPAADHPLFRHPAVLATPHVASATHPATAARQVVAAIGRHRAGQRVDHAVDRTRGY